MKVGILYNFVDEISKGKDIDKIADNEVLETADAIRNALRIQGHSADLVRVNNTDLDECVEDLKKNYDLVFNLAEGIDGDNLAESRIARNLSENEIRFTGSDHDALATCVDKAKTKELLIRNRIPTPRYAIFDCAESVDRIASLKFPMIVKPVHEDGSIGITSDSVVRTKDELKRKVTEIIDIYKQPALVEEFIDGREINAAIIGNGKDIEVLPLSEITFDDFPENVPKIVSFDAKWIEDSEQYIKTSGRCPADLDSEITEKIKILAKKSFLLTGCRDYARVDFRIRDNKPYVIEVNPNPCINPNGAGFIRSANTAGYGYNDIIHKIVRTALDRNSMAKELEIKAIHK